MYMTTMTKTRHSLRADDSTSLCVVFCLFDVANESISKLRLTKFGLTRFANRSVMHDALVPNSRNVCGMNKSAS
jgi:hypothetical protein